MSINITNLTKKYNIYGRKRDILKELFDPRRRTYHREFWALDGINCTIFKGETVGIIGKNGAGKSTLLKIITGVLSPTSGTVLVKGRISSLLELGAGFNPEYNGIENIYLQGIISGFSHEEMEEKAESILQFADIGDFVHQKVKHYSSGMYARLAFAVAINTDPDILIVDEALSVGDMRFQQKCYRKFTELQNSGKTILFVTHDIAMIKNYCSRALWISDGKIVDDGAPEDVCKRYTAQMSYDLAPEIANKTDKKSVESETDLYWISTEHAESFGEKGAEIIAVSLYNSTSKESCISYRYGDWITVEAIVQAHQDINSPGIGVIFKDRIGNQIFGIGNYIYDVCFEPITENSKNKIRIEFSLPPIQNGEYSVSIALSEGTQEIHTQHHWVHDITSIMVHNDAIAFRIGNIVTIDKELVTLRSEVISGA